MKQDYFGIFIENEETEDLYDYLIGLEVELDNELAGMFRMSFSILGENGRSWKLLDDERLMVWKQVTIKYRLEDSTEELISGYITHVKPYFDPDPAQSMLEIWGLDKSVLMDREEKLMAWPGKKDSDIATEIFNSYGFETEVDDTKVVHEKDASTIIQRETDMQFLRRLAFRNGFQCYVEGDKGFFMKPGLDEAPQALLIVHSGDETNVIRFSAEINALSPLDVSFSQIDRFKKSPLLAVTVNSSKQKILGKTNAASIQPSNIPRGKVYIAKNVTTGYPEMEIICQQLYHQRGWFVTGEGVIAGNYYGHVLKPRRTVTIKGIGETYSGVYYVTHVTHSFGSSGENYTQFFKVKRNAIMPTGSEDFVFKD